MDSIFSPCFSTYKSVGRSFPQKSFQDSCGRNDLSEGNCSYKEPCKIKIGEKNKKIDKQNEILSKGLTDYNLAK